MILPASLLLGAVLGARLVEARHLGQNPNFISDSPFVVKCLMRLLKKLAPWRYWAGGEAVTRPGWLPVVFDSPASWRCRSSGRPQRSRRLAAGDELDKPFEILSGRRQVELLRHIPETPQPDAPHPEPLLEFGK